MSVPPPGDDRQKEVESGLQEVAKKLFMLCSPWAVWRTSGSFIAELPDVLESDEPGKPPPPLTETDTVGERILAFVPQQLLEAFLSSSGQAIVSSLPLSPPSSTLTLAKSEVEKTMNGQRTAHVHRLRISGAKIFGLNSEFFDIEFDRSQSEVCQKLLGVQITPKGKHYPILPPILYPEGSMDPKKLFLNTAIIRVSNGSGVWSGVLNPHSDTYRPSFGACVTRGCKTKVWPKAERKEMGVEICHTRGDFIRCNFSMFYVFLELQPMLISIRRGSCCPRTRSFPKWAPKLTSTTSKHSNNIVT
jgi:hypothetical protein